MTSWWELVIPAASVVGGAVVTGLIQGIATQSKRRNDAKIRSLDAKRIAYAQFLNTWDEYRELAEQSNSRKEFIRDMDARIDAQRTALEAAIKLGESPDKVKKIRAEYSELIKEVENSQNMHASNHQEQPRY